MGETTPIVTMEGEGVTRRGAVVGVGEIVIQEKETRIIDDAFEQTSENYYLLYFCTI